MKNTGVVGVEARVESEVWKPTPSLLPPALTAELPVRGYILPLISTSPLDLDRSRSACSVPLQSMQSLCPRDH